MKTRFKYKLNFLVILFALLFLSSNSLISQELQLERVSIGESVSVKFPDNFELFDTLFQTIHVAYLENQTLIISKIITNKHKNNNFENLKKGYKKFRIGVLETIPNSNLLEEEFITIDSLLGLRIKYTGNIEGAKMTIDASVFFIKNQSYSFQNIYNENDFESLAITSEELINSIEFEGLNSHNQIEEVSEMESSAYKWGQLVGKILIYGIIVITIIYFVWENKKKK